MCTPARKEVPISQATVCLAGGKNVQEYKGLEMPHPIPKSVLSHVGRQALSDLNSTPLPGARVLGSKLQSAEPCASSLQRAVSSDGVELRGVMAAHNAVASTCLHKSSPECGVPVLSSVTESPDEKALLHTSIEAMHLPLDCSEDSYVLPEEDSLGAIDDCSNHSLSPPSAPGAEDFSPGLAGAGMDRVELISTPEWRELTPEAAVSDLELTDEEDAANVSDIEKMHPHDDDENLFDIPDEFKLDDKHLAILRDVCGVAWHQKHEAAPATPSTPPEFALPIVPTIADYLVMEDYVYLESLEKPIGGPLELVPLE
ncbi:uncharacterized protein LOC144163275 isoform X1 [Haemaphysalis longicornis]